jgi:hypothetical protein
MLDPILVELVDRMVRVQFKERETQLGREILQEKYRSAKSGGPSSVTVERVYDLCGHDIEIRTLIVWQNLLRVLSQAGVVASETLAQDLKEVVQSYRAPIYDYPDESLQKVASSTSFTSRRTLTDAWDRAVTKVETEIDLFVLSLRRASKDQQLGSPPPVFHISSVGAIQTGPNATASIVMNIGAEDREVLLRALDLVKGGLAGVESLPAHLRAEIIDLVDEVKSELKKPKPNGTRLGSLASTIATAIQTAGSLQPAYQALKAALLPLGIMLP